jgi:PAS domain S-box-containing protein
MKTIFAEWKENGLVEDEEVTIITKTGETRTVLLSVNMIRDEEGRILHSISVQKDITKRLEAEKGLRESEEKYRVLVEQSPLGIVIGQTPPIRIVFANLAFARIMGYTREELVSLSQHEIEELVHPEDQSIFFESFRDKLMGKSGLQDYEIRGIRKDGTEVWIQVSGAPIKYEGKPAVQSTFTNINERKRIEKDLRKTADSAMLYLDLLGHDIRNHLQVVLLGIDLIRLADVNTDNSLVLDYLNEQVLRAQGLISKVQATRDLLTTPLTEMSLISVLNSCLKEIRSLNPNTCIEERYTLDHAVVKADQYLHILLMNILENAIIHNPNENQQLWVVLQEFDGGYKISIADNGPGISDDKKGSIFDRNRRFGGIGVHQTKQILDKYHGWIKVQDRIHGAPNQGVKFCIWLPKM